MSALHLPRMRDSYGVSGFGVVVYLVGGILAFCAVLVPIIIGAERHYGRIACRTFATQTGRQTRFVIYTTFDGGDCLTRSGGGTWIPTKNLREFGSKP